MFSRTERWNSEMSCGTTAIAARRLSCVTRAMSCPSIRMRPPLHVVEALQQREQRRLSAARAADQSDALARLDAQIEIVENLAPVRMLERDLVELDARAAAHQRRGLGMIAQLMRHQQRRKRLRQPGDVLGHVDERDRQDRVSRAGPISPSVQASTTSPVVISPRCHSTMAQASKPIVSTTVTSACRMRSRSR